MSYRFDDTAMQERELWGDRMEDNHGGDMSWMTDELDERITREYAWFDAGWFAGALIGGGLVMLYYHGTILAYVGYFALWGTLHHFKALQKLRSVVDTVEATVKRWAGL